MANVTSVDRLGLERGFQRGWQEGWLEGWREGFREGQYLMLRRLLTKRFGLLPEQIQERLAQANSIQLELWAEALFDDASKLSDLFG